MLRGSRQGFTCNHRSAEKVNMEDQEEFPQGSLHDQPMREDRQTQTKGEGHSCCKDPVGMGQEESSLTERAECGSEGDR